MTQSRSKSRHQTKRTQRGRVVSHLRAGVLASAAMILCWRFTVTTGIVASALGAYLGALFADRLTERDRARGSLRLGSGLLMAGAILLVGGLVSRLVVGSEQLADWIGPLPTLHLGDGVLWLSFMGAGAFALRLLVARRPALAVLEVAAVASSLAVALAAHRQGMVHRPLAIGDWAWTRGLDPSLVFLVLGGLGTLLLAGLMVQEGRKRRLPLHFSALLAVAFLLLVFVRVQGLPAPDPSADLGLTGEPEDGRSGEEREAARRKDGGRGQGQPRPGQEQGDGQRQLGELEFRDEYGNSGHQAPVAVVLLHDDYSPPSGVYYFRQSAFSQYNGRRLVQALSDELDRDVVHRFPFADFQVPGAPGTSGDRKALITSIGLMVDHVRPFALDSPVILRPADNPDPMRFQRVFEVRSHVLERPYADLLGLRAGDPSWSDDTWRTYTESPDDPRYDELAQSLLASLRSDYRDDPLGKALAIKIYLDENGIYSRKSRHAGARDPAASFLFGDLTGYCVHFAHAATYLMRSVGIPARVAAGYAVSEAARAGGSTVLIQGGDAHAWPEIYLDGVGWVVVDLAPAQSLDQPNQLPDQRLQQMLGEMMRQERRPDDPFREQMSRAIDWATLGRRFLWLLAILVVAGWLIKAQRAAASRFGTGEHQFRVSYRAALDRLADVGEVRRPGETRERFAQRVGDLSPSFSTLTRHHVAWALGSSRLPEAKKVQELSRGVSRDLAESLPWWRRAVGRLDPTSWLRAR
ncbi:MAG: transglutaminase-like domain-containing protein [Thermoanaerobaculia bacterium]|nr:transglutaminase-like domain-containing protein [Thermoanaerobaculia bacterium]